MLLLDNTILQDARREDKFMACVKNWHGLIIPWAIKLRTKT